MNGRNRRSKGFSLIELLIVVAIILIIAAIAIPKLLQARNTASQANAAATMRSINTAVNMFVTEYPSAGYPATVSVLGGALPCTKSVTTACVLDDTIAKAVDAGSLNGYSWTYTVSASPADFVITAAPAASNGAVRSYWINSGGTVHYNDSGPATSLTPVLGN